MILRNKYLKNKYHLNLRQYMIAYKLKCLHADQSNTLQYVYVIRVVECKSQLSQTKTFKLDSYKIPYRIDDTFGYDPDVLERVSNKLV